MFPVFVELALQPSKQNHRNRQSLSKHSLKGNPQQLKRRVCFQTIQAKRAICLIGNTVFVETSDCNPAGWGRVERRVLSPNLVRMACFSQVREGGAVDCHSCASLSTSTVHNHTDFILWPLHDPNIILLIYLKTLCTMSTVGYIF